MELCQTRKRDASVSWERRVGEEGEEREGGGTDRGKQRLRERDEKKKKNEWRKR